MCNSLQSVIVLWSFVSSLLWAHMLNWYRLIVKFCLGLQYASNLANFYLFHLYLHQLHCVVLWYRQSSLPNLLGMLGLMNSFIICFQCLHLSTIVVGLLVHKSNSPGGLKLSMMKMGALSLSWYHVKIMFTTWWLVQILQRAPTISHVTTTTVHMHAKF